MGQESPERSGRKRSDRIDMGSAIVIGAIAGLVIGTALGELVLGMGLGMCIGVVVGALSNKGKETER